jgi:hypothetical protein
MSLKFLIGLLNWLQDEFVKTAENHRNAAADRLEKIKAMQVSQTEHLQSAKLAEKMAAKIENLLSE